MWNYRMPGNRIATAFGLAMTRQKNEKNHSYRNVAFISHVRHCEEAMGRRGNPVPPLIKSLRDLAFLIPHCSLKYSSLSAAARSSDTSPCR